jgi:hypothetical protein
MTVIRTETSASTPKLGRKIALMTGRLAGRIFLLLPDAVASRLPYQRVSRKDFRPASRRRS